MSKYGSGHIDIHRSMSKGNVMRMETTVAFWLFAPVLLSAIQVDYGLKAEVSAVDA